MKVLVLIKQVPDVSTLRLDPEQRRLIRHGVQLFANPFDLRALALAVRLKTEYGASVIAATMGPPQAREVLDLARAVGAERCVLICDPLLAGSDTLVTATVLAEFARREAPDLIVTGQYSVDSETGQVPEQVAALLDRPCLPAVREFSLDEGGRRISVTCETEDGMEWAQVALPVVLSTAERLMPPAKATPEQLEAVREEPVETLRLADLGLSAERVGSAGSPTWVAEVRAMETLRQPVRLSDPRPEAFGAAVRSVVVERLGRAAADRHPMALAPAASNDAAPRSVWVLLETLGPTLSTSSKSLLGLGRHLGGEVTGVLLGGASALRCARHAIEYGADRVINGHNAHLEPFTSEAWAVALDTLMRGEGQPRLILASASRVGRGTLARVAARRGIGLIGDCIGIEPDPDGTLYHLKPAFGGNMLAPIRCRTHPELATVVPGTLPLVAPTARTGRIDLVEVACPAPRVTVVRSDRSAAAAATALDQAELVVCVGNAFENEAELDLVRQCLARLERATGLRGALAATRRVTDSGWLPRQVQVGLTGRAIAPRLYIGVGVRGAPYHLVGIKHAQTIVAINSDSSAPIFDDCDLGLVGRWQEILPALAAELELRVGPRRAGA